MLIIAAAIAAPKAEKRPMVHFFVRLSSSQGMRGYVRERQIRPGVLPSPSELEIRMRGGVRAVFFVGAAWLPRGGCIGAAHEGAAQIKSLNILEYP